MKQNYFELFQLPVSFDINIDDLTTRHRAVVSRIHPDQFAHKSSAEQRMALQWTTFANEAFDTLKSPIKRAQYLLQLNAPELVADPHTHAPLPPEFLMQQMAWREALEDGSAADIRDEVEKANQAALLKLKSACMAQDWGNVQNAIAECQFIENFLMQLPQK